MRHACVFFHAHPDDEALLTAGTMARLAAEGHRVVLVVATAGEQGLAAPEAVGEGSLGTVRTAELHASAKALGCARVEFLGYADSGLDGAAVAAPGGPTPFASADVEEAATRLADLLREENASLLTTYDPAGGYGHPDHVRVHHVGARAAEIAGTPVVLEATVDRDLLLRGLRLASKVYPFPPEFDPRTFETAYSPRAAITHKVDVRRYTPAKRQSMAAHVTQATGGDSTRTLAALLRIPRPLFRWTLGTEWYVQRGTPPGRVHRHPLATLTES
ncbi:PIG-L deacetylase family protein [Streptoalloteichus hindustanus]|uniref:N-acetylglucosaminyl deacetylase, LmbE family n=1 Tax=Streptoalloteichus hindustanus TaxID=2017 RepID=A0A1M5GEB4_STRHI|nr:PIG-L family deacetylase [Streptoalloteichus hindustanus]SHG02039.1 N-acetylglucosaminyl deacetylase, LmbE family [Streptoalloteichus hindustanus]